MAPRAESVSGPTQVATGKAETGHAVSRQQFDVRRAYGSLCARQNPVAHWVSLDRTAVL